MLFQSIWRGQFGALLVVLVHLVLLVIVPLLPLPFGFFVLLGAFGIETEEEALMTVETCSRCEACATAGE